MLVYKRYKLKHTINGCYSGFSFTFNHELLIHDNAIIQYIFDFSVC